jgi:4-amino-4-deoxy-L-arabinose transferase-like glycosyltransferase
MPVRRSPLVAHIVALLIIVAVGAAVRVSELGIDNFDRTEVDEINRAEAIRFPRAAAGSPVASISTLLTAATLGWGYGEATLRLPQVAAGVLTIIAVWGLGGIMFGAETALFAAAALAVAPLHVALSRSVGADVWLTLFATLTVLAFILAVQAPQDPRRGMTFAATAALTYGCAYRALLVFAALAVAAVVIAVREPPLRRWVRRPLLVMLLIAAAASLWATGHPPRLIGTFLWPDFGWIFQLQLLSQLATGQPQRWWAGVALLACVIVGMVTSGGSRSGIVTAMWLLIGCSGLLVNEWFRRLVFRPGDIGFIVPAYALLGAAGLVRLRQLAFANTGTPLVVASQAAVLVFLLALELPGLADQRNQHPPAWRAAAEVVATNTLPDDVIVVLNQQPSFAFYAPDLDRRLEPDVRPGRAAGYFVHPERNWLVVPQSLRYRGGWKVINNWLARYPPVDLSPDAATVVLYMGHDGRDQLLFETAYFKLPTATLVHGDLLFEWLQQMGPLPAVLWKVDQIALSRERLDFRNPSLLNAVYYLAQNGHGDRAASLAYRLATAAPDWDDAQRALEAFRPAS